jgi:peptidyl-tRNA hydrolase
MYYVVRKDVPRTLGQAMAQGGAAAVRCDERFGGGDTFAAWRASSFRKVALRASAEELERVRGEEHCVAAAGGTLLCLAPMARSDSSPLLAGLRPFTDPPRPDSAPEPLSGALPAMLYVIRPGVMKTAGKAIAQAGHAAMMCVYEWGARDPRRFAAWRAAGEPGELAQADAEQWERVREELDGVVVRDGGHTQVDPGTETVMALVPGPRTERPHLALSLGRVD